MIAWIVAVVALVPLGITLLNRWAWPRGRAAEGVLPAVSVCIPARDEAAHIETCVWAALHAGAAEVVVLDDGSTDATPEILARLSAAVPALRVRRWNAPLPAGWVGKAHACHLLAQEAAHELLLFVDADTVLAPDGLRRLLDLRARYRAQVVTALPRQLTGTFAERLMMPLLAMSSTAWLPLSLVWWSRDPRLVVANGQLLLLEAEALRRAGGFRAIRHEVVDDLALARRFKEVGQRVVFADGSTVASTRMYQGGRELWRGFSKNAWEGLGENPVLLVGAVVLHLVAFVAPWVLLVVAPSPAAALAVGANLLQRAVLARRLGHRAWSVLLHPVAVAGLIGILINSLMWSRSDRITWRGRRYARRSARRAEAT